MTTRLKRVYRAAQRYGLVVTVTAGSDEFSAVFQAADDEILSGRGLGRDYTIRYLPTTSLKDGDVVTVRGDGYTVRGHPRALRDGSELIARLSKS